MNTLDTFSSSLVAAAEEAVASVPLWLWIALGIAVIVILGIWIAGWNWKNDSYN